MENSIPDITTDLVEIIWGENEDYVSVTEPIFIDQGRWTTTFEQVFKRTTDGTFWRLSWSRGSTEYQDDGPQDIEVIQVEPKEVTVTKYFPVREIV